MYCIILKLLRDLWLWWRNRRKIKIITNDVYLVYTLRIAYTCRVYIRRQKSGTSEQKLISHQISLCIIALPIRHCIYAYHYLSYKLRIVLECIWRYDVYLSTSTALSESRIRDYKHSNLSSFSLLPIFTVRCKARILWKN